MYQDLTLPCSPVDVQGAKCLLSLRPDLCEAGHYVHLRPHLQCFLGGFWGVPWNGSDGRFFHFAWRKSTYEVSSLRHCTFGDKFWWKKKVLGIPFRQALGPGRPFRCHSIDHGSHLNFLQIFCVFCRIGFFFITQLCSVGFPKIP